jgi:hypothetical protein
MRCSRCAMDIHTRRKRGWSRACDLMRVAIGFAILFFGVSLPVGFSILSLGFLIFFLYVLYGSIYVPKVRMAKEPSFNATVDIVHNVVLLAFV